jgi:hypothetical protein
MLVVVGWLGDDDEMADDDSDTAGGFRPANSSPSCRINRCHTHNRLTRARNAANQSSIDQNRPMIDFQAGHRRQLLFRALGKNNDAGL